MRDAHGRQGVPRIGATSDDDTERSQPAVGIGYYAILNEARSALGRWGVPVPAKADVDDFVISRFIMVPNVDLLRVADALAQLRDKRELADNSLSTPGIFADEKEVNHLLQRADIGIDLISQIEADPARQAKAVADIRAVFP